MMPYLYLALTFLAGYLIGSVNLSLIVTKYIGKLDIYSVGSGNAGGTNVARSMGLKWGIAVIVAEIVKCMAPGMIAKYLLPGNLFVELGEVGACITGIVCAAGCLFGNFYPCFAHFRGGKGVSVMGGMLIILDWRIFAAVLALFLILILTTRMVSVGSITCAALIPVAIGLVYSGKPGWIPLTAVAAVMSVSVILRHRGNLKRIFTGTERKISFGKKK